VFRLLFVWWELDFDDEGRSCGGFVVLRAQFDFWSLTYSLRRTNRPPDIPMTASLRKCSYVFALDIIGRDSTCTHPYHDQWNGHFEKNGKS
jgi:hypothetical protein